MKKTLILITVAVTCTIFINVARGGTCADTAAIGDANCRSDFKTCLSGFLSDQECSNIKATCKEKVEEELQTCIDEGISCRQACTDTKHTDNDVCYDDYNKCITYPSLPNPGCSTMRDFCLNTADHDYEECLLFDIRCNQN